MTNSSQQFVNAWLASVASKPIMFEFFREALLVQEDTELEGLFPYIFDINSLRALAREYLDGADHTKMVTKALSLGISPFRLEAACQREWERRQV